MLRSILPLFLLALIASCANPLQVSIAEAPVAQPEPYHSQYDRSALQSLKWLTGTWKGKESGQVIKQSFLFHTENMLEVTPTEGNSQKAAQYFIWKDGRYYYGQNRQWMVTWMSEKNIRFDPLAPGLKPMTWSRLNDDKWHLIRHESTGDEIIVMERVDEVNS